MYSNPHQLTNEVKLLQKTVIFLADKFLILKRSSDSTSRPDQWDLPGGNSEWPVAPLNVKDVHRADVVREIFEETGIEVAETEVKDCVHVSTYFEGEKGIYTIILGWQIMLPAEFSEGEVLISDEHSEYAWITKEQFDGYDFGFAGVADGFIRKMVF